jgi:hypothetical protein
MFTHRLKLQLFEIIRLFVTKSDPTTEGAKKWCILQLFGRIYVAKSTIKFKAARFFERFLLLFSSSLEAAASTEKARYEQGFRAQSAVAFQKTGHVWPQTL